MAQTEVVYQQIARRLRELREREGLSQAEMGQSLGVSQSAYSLYESAERRMALNDIDRLARQFGVPVTWFLGEEVSPEQLLGIRYQQLPDSDKAIVNRIIEALTYNRRNSTEAA